MSKLKSVLNYVAGIDLLEDRKTRQGLFRNKLDGDRLSAIIDDCFDFGTRFAPTVMEIDSIRRLLNEDYLYGTIELLGAEVLRVAGYLDTKRQRALSNSYSKTLEE